MSLPQWIEHVGERLPPCTNLVHIPIRLSTEVLCFQGPCWRLTCITPKWALSAWSAFTECIQAVIVTKEVKREEAQPSSSVTRSKRLPDERQRRLDSARELDGDYEQQWKPDASDFTESRMGGAAGRLQLDLVREYRKPVGSRLCRAAE